MGGPELVRRAREDDPGLAVIFLSGFPGHALDPGDLVEERVTFLQKPPSRGALRVALEAVRAA